MPDHARCPRCHGSVEVVRIAGRPMRVTPRGSDVAGKVYFCAPCDTCFPERDVRPQSWDDKPFNERIHERSTA